jgi:hypothetical protein
MLSYAAHSPEKQHVTISFKAVQVISFLVTLPIIQLICTDFLPFLSKKCLQQYIVTVGAYGGQKVDLNVTFTAMNLLWNVSDFLAQEAQKALKPSEETSLAVQIVEQVIQESILAAVEKQIKSSKNISW